MVDMAIQTTNAITNFGFPSMYYRLRSAMVEKKMLSSSIIKCAFVTLSYLPPCPFSLSFIGSPHRAVSIDTR